MGLMDFLKGNTAAGIVKEGLGAVGSGVSNILDRFIPKKMSETEKAQDIKDVMGLDNQAAGIEVQDVNKAREMYMTFMRTQKMPWLPRFINAMFRPSAGVISLLYLTDQFWAQLLTQFIEGFIWNPIKRDPVVDSLVAVIIYFFFGYRHAAKKRGITTLT